MSRQNLITEKEKRYQASKRVTVVGAVANVILSVGKIVAGVLGHSPVMVADGVHSASDLVSDAVVMWGMRMGKAAPDVDHPYGHGRFETIATLVLAMALLGVAVGIMYDAVARLQNMSNITVPTTIALWGAMASILIKEGLYHYTVLVGKRYNAKTIIANAWHHRSDAISSVAALAGISGAMMGMPLLDPVAAIAVAVIVFKMGIGFARDTLKELSDAAIDHDVRKKVDELVVSIPEVRDAHFLKGRQMGSDILIDVHVEVHPYISVSEGHQIAETVRFTLLNAIKEINDVLVHVDTIDDHVELFPKLPTRRDLLPQVELIKAGVDGIHRIERFSLNYTPQGIIADISISLAGSRTLDQAQGISDRFREQLLTVDTICNACVHLFLTDGGTWKDQKRQQAWVKAEG